MHGWVLLYLLPTWLGIRDGNARFRGYLSYRATTMSLAGIVATQIGNVFAYRTERESVFKVGFFKNKLFLLGIVSELIIISALIYTPFLQKIFGLAPLGLMDWGFLFAFPPFSS
ncbi:MAG: cation-translocating P-type ATPase C-terminal domain-containing protein [Candidatus Jettenia sp. CY-1]|nr:cation-translocating P-type ATPase C-terminal domain-containing protein [Candidatus Jettenia sp.]WKZ18661.1 MAG: cation-translocating P-type ATPase C-terminal domain-containing protein [Candidatus Jettenia sp. CY-1]